LGRVVRCWEIVQQRHETIWVRKREGNQGDTPQHGDKNFVERGWKEPVTGEEVDRREGEREKRSDLNWARNCSGKMVAQRADVPSQTKRLL